IATLMAEKKTLQDPALALDTYNHICCLSGRINDVCQLGLMLQASALPLTSESTRSVQQTLAHSGLYELSQPFFQRTGFSCKSGVSGVMLACLPTTPPAVMVSYSPPLDAQGHSVFGLNLLDSLAAASRNSV
ncbi:MAG: glutaminase, partial [Synechocystis sp.]|nr:glutaminase [Synechocystis sp.]